MNIRNIPIEELKQVVANSISWSDAMRKCGKIPRGASFQFFQARVKKFEIDTSHFLGKAAHTGFRHTGLAKKKHWSEVLIKRKTSDREKTQRFRRSYREYCLENKITIKCVDCGNDGTWMGKLLTLQINHIDADRTNNIPKNLEWVCPNCHEVKTIY
jgi:hypothetical protein